MLYRQLSLGAQVSAVGFGGAAISGEEGGYGFGKMSEKEAVYLLQQALDLGINVFDTAPIYGFRTSEQRIGKAFRDRREEVYLVSKCGVTWDFGKRMRVDNSPISTDHMLHQTLQDLQTDYLDLYLVHWPDPKVDIRQTMEVLALAQEEGKIKAIGLSNSNPEEIRLASEVVAINVLQNEFNLFRSYPREQLFEMVQEQIGFMSWGTLDKGILTGRVDREREFEASDVRSHAPWWTESDQEPKFKAMEQILPLLEERGHTGLEMALGYVLQFAEVQCALCGIRDTDQLQTTLKALDHLPDKELLDAVYHIAQENGAVTS